MGIRQELAKATEIEQDKGEALQAYFKRLMKEVAALNDKQWDRLSKEAQDWYNDAADAANAKKDELPGFPDEKAEEPVKSTRRGAKAEEPAAEGRSWKVGDRVKVTTKRGKVYEGELIELDKEQAVIKTADDEVELDLDRIDTTEVFHGQAGLEDPAEPEFKVGSEVKVITKRGKEYTGKIVEMDDAEVVLDVDGKDVELDRERIESMTPVGAKAAGTGKDEAKAEEKTTTRRGSAKAEEPAAGDKVKRASNDGVSIGTRIKEIIAEDLDITEEGVAKILKKEGIEFRENTLKLNYTDCSKFIAILKKAKLLK